MTFVEYLALPGVNFSTLKHLRRSPRHYAYAVANQRPDTASLRLGRAVHAACLEPDRFALDYVVFTGARRAGKEWDAFELTHDGRTILKLDEYQRALAIRDAVRSHPLVAPYLVEGEAEKVLTWTDQTTGLALKARLDWLAPTAVVDLKTSRDATNPRKFAASAWDLGYYHQLAHYTAGTNAVTGWNLPAIVIAVEPSAPFDVAVFRLDEDALAIAGGQVDELLVLLAQCREANVWPGAHDAEITLGLPKWALPDVEDLDLEDPDWAAGA